MIEQAGLVGFLRTALIILVVYYLLRFLMRIFVPMLIKKVFKQQAPYAGQNSKNDQKDRSKKQKNGNKKDDDRLGEYVDFEEVE